MAHYTIRQEQAYVHAEPEEDPERALIEVGENEFVLDSEYRGANRVVVAVATPVEVARRCQYVKDDGGQCSRDAEEGSDYCWQHGGDE